MIKTPEEIENGYNPETDFNGSWGHGLADTILRRYHKFQPKTTLNSRQSKLLKKIHTVPISEEHSTLEDTNFEDRFFAYNPDEDEDGSIGEDLMKRVEEMAKIEGVPTLKWVEAHRLFYDKRHKNDYI
jgi:hypothetical protein